MLSLWGLVPAAFAQCLPPKEHFEHLGTDPNGAKLVMLFKLPTCAIAMG